MQVPYYQLKGSEYLYLLLEKYNNKDLILLLIEMEDCTTCGQFCQLEKIV